MAHNGQIRDKDGNTALVPSFILLLLDEDGDRRIRETAERLRCEVPARWRSVVDLLRYEFLRSLRAEIQRQVNEKSVPEYWSALKLEHSLI